MQEHSWFQIGYGLPDRPARILAVLAMAGLAALCSGTHALAANPSASKLSIHGIWLYTSGAQQVVAAHPRILKILDTGGGMLSAMRDYKAGTPAGKVLLRIYSTQSFTLADDPTASADSFWNVTLAPPINALSQSDKLLIDYLEGPNEGDSTPTFNSLAEVQWFSTFWLRLADLIANAGYRPMMGSIAVGNPPGDTAYIHSCLDIMVPALRKCKAYGGGWTYHDYSGPAMTTDLGTEIYFSLRYRQYYDYFNTNYPDLSNLPLIGSEGGGYYGWTQVGATYFENWLTWHEQQVQQDSYFMGDTLFQIGDPNGWPTFDLEPIAGWLATQIASAGTVTPPATPTGLSATAGDGQVSLSWNAASGATSYWVKRSTVNGGPYTTFANPTNPSYTNTGLSNGTTYYYVVAAANANAESTNSSQVSATPSGSSGMYSGTPTGTNLSLTATQVSTDSNYSSSYAGDKAKDGVVSAASKWCSNGNTPPHWIALDLGGNRTVNGFIARLAGAAGEYTSYNFKNFKFQSGTSISGPWTDECTVDNTAQANVVARAYYSPKTLRYLRIYITNCGIDNYARFPEFEIWGVAPSPTITRSPATLAPSCTQGSNASNQSFTVQNTGGGTLSYTISTDQSWLSCNPISGTSTGEVDTITVSYATSGLAIGTYNATITITDPNATNNPQTIAVTLTVNSQGMNNNTPTGVNVATSSSQVSTDSNYSGDYTGAKAIDGVVSAASKWCSTASSSTHWLALDLGSTKTVNGYIVRMAGAAGEYTSYNFKNFKIQSGTSISGPWTDECTVDNSAQANVITRSYYTAPSLRYIRIYITNCGIDNYARLPEFEVYAPGGSPQTVSEDFTSMPSWTSSYDASWGSAATWSIVSGGQSGNALQATRSTQGSSAKVMVYSITANTNYTISVYIKCPSYAGAYWAECAYYLGSNTASDFDNNPTNWTMIKKFSDTGTNGNGNTWTQYSATFNSGSNTQISVGYKLGSSGGGGPTVLWDTLRVQ